MGKEATRSDPLPHIIIDGLEHFDSDRIDKYVSFARKTHRIMRFIVISTGDKVYKLQKVSSDGEIFETHYIGNINKSETTDYLTNTCQISNKQDLCVTYKLFGGSLLYLNKLCVQSHKDSIGSEHSSKLFVNSVKKIEKAFWFGRHFAFFTTKGLNETAKSILAGNDSVKLFSHDIINTLAAGRHYDVIVWNNDGHYEFSHQVYKWFLEMTFNNKTTQDVLDQVKSECLKEDKNMQCDETDSNDDECLQKESSE